MKAEINKEKPQKKAEFVPFDLTLKVETVAEARTLFHMFNFSGLGDLFKGPQGYEFEDYNPNIAEDLTAIEDKFPQKIEEHLNTMNLSVYIIKL